MALRIHETVVRGEIDNRKRGVVRGSIWLVGREEPVSLEFTGNCLPDLAGCLVRFENPQATQTAEEMTHILNRQQKGVTGDMTASRKVRVFDVPLEDALRMSREGGSPPEHMANSLYIEWFSEANGRVVIESSDYTIDVSAPAWTLSPKEEQKQIAASHQAIRDWLGRIDQRRTDEEPAEFDPDSEKPLDEFGYEKFMRESDARTDKYMELLEKYEGHPDCEKIVARQMGWEWLEEALEADERGALPPREEPAEIPPLEPNPATEGVDWIRDEEGHIHHPLARRAFESGVAMWHFCNDQSLLGEDGDSDLREMIFEFQTTGAKLAGALNGLAYDEDLRDGGFVVAALKRALNYLHKSIAAAEKVAQKKLLPSERLDPFRADLFDIREQVLALMERFRGKDF
jgi:hypothetical protein